MCVGSWAGVTYLRYTVLMSPKKDETAVHCCDPALTVLVILVSRNVFHVLSALWSTDCRYIFILADQISCRSYVGIVCSPLQFLVLLVCSTQSCLLNFLPHGRRGEGDSKGKINQGPVVQNPD